jgi:hypothetical protein
VKTCRRPDKRLEVQTAPAPTVQAESMEMEVLAPSVRSSGQGSEKAVVAAGGTVAELREAYGQEIEPATPSQPSRSGGSAHCVS